MKFSKKIIAAVLAALMAISMMPFTVFAAPPGSSDIGTGASGGISIGGGSTVVGEGPYLTFTGTDSFSIKTNNNAKNWKGTLEYSTDTNTWTTWDGTSEISSDNDVLYLRGTGNTQITGSGSMYWVITTQGTVACSGDIRTLLDYDEPESSNMGTSCFSYLFKNCTSLTAAPELPATILANYCYSNMFNGCANLTTAPELPSTTLANYCYQSMFNGCANLTTAPELPATTLADYCYFNMFYGCANLTTAPELPATTLTNACYQSMFQGCANLTTAPVLPATELAPNCYRNMFNGCTSLTTAPELPATTLAERCYSDMFYGCESLTTAPELPATELANYCYYNMFKSCRSLTTAPELPATTLRSNCYYSMFQNCTSLTTPSELPATDLTDFCYYTMFRGCTGIKLSTEQTAEYSIPYSIPEEGTGSMGSYSLTDMFTNTGGTFKGTPTINTTYYLAAPAPSAYAGYVPAESDDATALAAKVVKFNGHDWYLIEDNSTSATEGTVTLFAADTSFGTKSFDNENLSNKYSTSQVKAYLDGMTETGGAFANVADAIETVTVTTDNDTDVTAKLYLLSKSEAGALPANVLMSDNFTNADYYGEAYWLRSPRPNDGMAAAYVDTTDGTIFNGSQVYRMFGVRPALQLDLSKVEFNSETKTFALPTPAPTSTVSFTKVTEASQITADNIGTCTADEATAWVQENWDAVYSNESFAYYAYYTETTGLNIGIIFPGVSKDYISNYIYTNREDDRDIEGLTYSLGRGEAVYLCTPAAPAPTEPNNGANLALEGIIEENIYIDADAYNLGDDAVIKVAYNASTNISETAQEVTDVYNVKDLTPFDDPKDDFDGTYKFAFKQAPAQITEDVVVALYADENAQEPVKTITYSTKDYCDNVIATSNNAKLVALCKSILDYGMAAQLEFEYNLENPAETDGFYNAAAIEALTYSDITGTRLEDGIGITGCAFQCLANTNINLYFDEPLTGAGIINAYVEDGNDQTPVSATYMRSTKTGRLFISVNGIAADDMTKDFTVVTSNNGSVTTNLNTIVKTCLYYGTATTLAKTIYFYANAANTYFN